MDRRKANARARELLTQYSERSLAGRVAVLEQELEAAKAKAATDALTGLCNRGAIMERLEQELARTRRNGSPTAVLMFDLDHFKLINDTHGHQAGDAVLRVVGELIRDTLRATDSAGRYGGEEFLVVMSQTTVQQAAVLAEKLRGRIGELHHPDVGSISVSVGVAGTTHSKLSTFSPTSVVGWADEKLYQAKHNGRNRVES